MLRLLSMALNIEVELLPLLSEKAKYCTPDLLIVLIQQNIPDDIGFRLPANVGSLCVALSIIRKHGMLLNSFSVLHEKIQSNTNDAIAYFTAFILRYFRRFFSASSIFSKWNSSRVLFINACILSLHRLPMLPS